MPDHSAPLPQFPFELSDADGTLQLPAADRTLTDLAPVDARAGVSPATARRSPAKAESTEELDAADILEVKRIVATPRAEGTQELDANDILEVEQATFEVTEPISIAPIALDVAPPRVVEPTLRVLRQQPLPGRREIGIYAVAGSFGVSALIGLGVLVSLAVRPGPEPVSALPALVAAAKESQIETKIEPTETKAAPALVVDPPAEPHAETIASRPRAPTTSAQIKTGTVRVAPSVRGILVDGSPRSVSGGALIVKCGRHKIKMAASAARMIDVPCGGTATL